MQLVQDPERLRAIAAEAAKFAKDHVVVICEEVLEWHNTSILREGRVRELARLLEPLADSYALSVAESYARRAAFEFVVQNRKTNE